MSHDRDADLALAGELEDLRDRVRRNEPHRRDPHRFHEEKSEIAGAINRIVSRLRGGKTSPRGRAPAQG